MFTSLELRPVQNGFIVTLNDEEVVTEYVFDSLRKTVKFIKDVSDTQTGQKNSDVN